MKEHTQNHWMMMQARPRRGFTLVEVMLVLAVMAIVAVMAWPMLRKPFASRRLHSAADEVRAQLCEARNEAMRSGHTYAFRYQLGGDRFRTEPQNAAGSSAGADTDYLADDDEYYGTSTEDALTRPEEKALPEGIKFLADATTAGEMPTSASDAAMSLPSGLAGDWSEPILFYPDGTASDVRLVLASNGSCAVRILLRGVTGTVTVADVAPNVE